MSNDIVIAGVTVKRDEDGLYCLNDLWRARGSKNGEKVNAWSKSNKTKQLIDSEVLKATKSAFKQSAGRYGGTYANKTLVYDYAMWISPEFKQHVIAVFDSHVTGNVKKSLDTTIESIKLNMIDINKAINSASTHFDDIKDCGASWGKAGSEIRKAKRQAIEQIEALKNEIQGKLEFK